MKCLPRGRDGCHTCYMDGRLREERLTPARHTGGLRQNGDWMWKDRSWHIHSAEEITRWRPRWVWRLQILSCKNRPDNACLLRIYPSVVAKYFAAIGQRILSECSQRLDKIITSPSSSYCKKKIKNKKKTLLASASRRQCFILYFCVREHPAERVLTANKSPKCSGRAGNLITYRNRACRERALRGVGSLCACGAVCIRKDAALCIHSHVQLHQIVAAGRIVTKAFLTHICLHCEP